MERKVGYYSFVGGIILAIILGIINAFNVGSNAVPYLSALLVLAGLIVGFINVADKETKDFLLVAAVLIVASGMGGASGALEKISPAGQISWLGSLLSGLFSQLLAFVVPATVVVALKEIIALSKI